jgi:hypothetical protein
MTDMIDRHFLRRGTGVARLVGTGLVLMLGTGCLDQLTQATQRDEIPPDALTTAAGAAALYAGALQRFGYAIDGNSGGTEGQTLVSGMMADEWFHSGTFTTRQDYDQRATSLDNGTLAGVFRNLQDARLAAKRAITAVEGTSANAAGDERIGALQNRIGAVYLIAAQNYCNGVPFSEVVDGQVEYGQPLTTADMLTEAVSWFDQALAGPAGAGSVNHNTARLLKARALTLEGRSQLSAAAALAASVPTDFAAVSEHSLANSTNENGVYVFNHLSQRWSMAHHDGGNGLPFRGAGDGTDPAQADPRLLWKRDGIGFDNESPQYDWLGSGDRDASQPFAKGQEARLIEAEAALEAGDAPGFMTKLNDLRATVAGLAPLTDPGTTAGREDLLFSERAFWLFGTGTRLSDLRREIRQYGRNAESIFPTGPYFRPGSGDYGNDVNIPVPNTEDQNPNFTACIDRNA